MNRSWLAIRFFSVDFFGYNFRCSNVNSVGPPSGGRRADWLDKTASLLLPQIDYFQVVFTLPEELSALMLGNRRSTYQLLFSAAWDALREVLREELECEPAALMVLHTWNQRLEHHPHRAALGVTAAGTVRLISMVAASSCGWNNYRPSPAKSSGASWRKKGSRPSPARSAKPQWSVFPTSSVRAGMKF